MSARWDERLCDGAVVTFGAWTLLANLTVLSGGSLDRLLVSAAVALALAVGAVVLRRRSPGERAPDSPMAEEGPSPLIVRGLQLVLLPVAAFYAVQWTSADRLDTLWWGALLALSGLAVLELFGAWRRPATAREGNGPPAPRDPAWASPALLALSLVAVVATLALHRPDPDEAFYVNLSVAAADAPGEALLSRDTLHGTAEPYPGIAVYKLQSFELLAGALARLTGLEALVIAQLILPACLAFLLPLALARLFRLLAPRRWIACVAVVLAIYLLVGDRPRGYANFGLVRLFTGKAVFCSLGVPLLAAYAIELVGSSAALRVRWLRLALAQAAAVGLTSSALWMAPAVAGLALLAAVEPTWASLRRALLGLTACAHPVAAGWWLLGELESAVQAIGNRVKPAELFEKAFDEVLGNGLLGALFLAALVGGWCGARTRLARRFVIVFSLGFLALLWNPHLAPLLAESVTGNATYWRVFWVVPLPLFFALAVTTPLALLPRARWLGLPLSIGLASVVYWGVSRPVLSPENGDRGTWLAWPRVKIPAEELAAARALAAHTESGDFVLAPTEVSCWLPTLHGHPFPLSVRYVYLSAQRRQIGKEAMLRRNLLTSQAGSEGMPGMLARQLGGAVPEFRLAGVCVSTVHDEDAGLAGVFEARHFSEVWRSQDYAVWTRPRDEIEAQPPPAARDETKRKRDRARAKAEDAETPAKRKGRGLRPKKTGRGQRKSGGMGRSGGRDD